MVNSRSLGEGKNPRVRFKRPAAGEAAKTARDERTLVRLSFKDLEKSVGG